MPGKKTTKPAATDAAEVTPPIEVPEELEKMNVHQRLLTVKRNISGYLQKENQGKEYAFVSSSQTLLAIREQMNAMGLLLVPKVTSHAWHDTGKTSSGAMKILTEVDITYSWVNSDDPKDVLECPWYGQGLDFGGEKGVGKAYTYAEKYFLLKFFNIATDKDDPDAHQGMDAAPSRAQSQHERVFGPATPPPAPRRKVDTSETDEDGLLRAKGTITAPQLTMVSILIDELGVDREAYKKTLKVESMKDLSMSQASKIISALKKKKVEREQNGVEEPAIQTEEEVPPAEGEAPAPEENRGTIPGTTVPYPEEINPEDIPF